MTQTCPFCTLPQERIIASNDLAIAIRDGFPVSPNHTLFIPRRHVADWFDATKEEQQAINELMSEIRKTIPADGFNIGINCGEVAGQTVMHLHVHLIPRYKNDQDDPRGGVRKIFPEKARYWK